MLASASSPYPGAIVREHRRQEQQKNSIENTAVRAAKQWEGRPASIIPQIDPWFDLVFHGLAHLDVPASDASRLFDGRYTTWVRDRWLRSGGVEVGGRTLPQDAPLMTDLYTQSGKGYLLNLFPLLWDGVDPFREQAATSLGEIVWPDERRRRIAETLRTHLGDELTELFRIALWSELNCGFEAFWRGASESPAHAFAEPFAREIERLAGVLPKLAEARFVLCHPLRHHGRLLFDAAGKPIIAVGVADPELDVPAMHPVVQACHEHFVWTSGVPGNTDDFATVPGLCGYEAFAAVEHDALRRGALFSAQSPWREAYVQWLAVTCPGRSPEELLREER